MRTLSDCSYWIDRSRPSEASDQNRLFFTANSPEAFATIVNGGFSFADAGRRDSWPWNHSRPMLS
jgi:hypothetical protein